MGNDIYKLELLKIIEVNTKDKSNSQIYHHNYQTWNFSTSCTLSINYPINKLGIATNEKIYWLSWLWLLRLVLYQQQTRIPTFYDTRVLVSINQCFPHYKDFAKFKPKQIIKRKMVYGYISQQCINLYHKIPLPWQQTSWPTEYRTNSVFVIIICKEKRSPIALVSPWLTERFRMLSITAYIKKVFIDDLDKNQQVIWLHCIAIS